MTATGDGDLGSDQTLCDAVANGDDDAAAALYTRHSGWSLGVISGMVSDPSAALDAHQNAWWACVRRVRRGVTLTGRFTTFLYPFLRHAAMKASRARRRPLRLAETSDANISPDPEAAAAIAALPAGLAEVIRLRYWHGLTDAEIADALGLPLGTVKGRLRAALRALRDRLHEENL